MSRLIIYSDKVTDLNHKLISVSYWEYLKLRIHFRTWVLHRTMGGPVLKLRAPTKANQEGRV